MKNKEKNKGITENPTGFSDILPKNENYWKFLYDVARSISELHDFHFIDTSVVEKYAVYENSFGDKKKEDLKEIFSLNVDRDKMALRYSFRESVLKSFFNNKLAYYNYPLKVFYMGKLFRNVEVDEYFLRSFHQIGFQVIGDQDPFYDAEIIVALYDFFRAVKLSGVLLRIGNPGCKNCRQTFRKKLQNYYYGKINLLCKNCRKNFIKNPFLLLECKEEKCLELRGDGPSIFDYLCSSCSGHLKSLIEFIEDNGINYKIDEYFVGWDDRNSKIIFDFFVPQIPHPIAFGSRYDYMSENLLKRFIPAVSGNIGVERVIWAMQKQNVVPKIKSKPKISFLVIGSQAKNGALKLMNKLRLSGICVSEMVGKKKLQLQIKTADKAGAKLAIILGQKEIFDGTAIVRDMTTGVQETILADKIVEEVKKRLSLIND